MFDAVTGYGPNMDEKKWLRRILFLETVAGALLASQCAGRNLNYVT